MIINTSALGLAKDAVGNKQVFQAYGDIQVSAVSSWDDGAGTTVSGNWNSATLSVYRKLDDGAGSLLIAITSDDAGKTIELPHGSPTEVYFVISGSSAPNIKAQIDQLYR